MSDSEFSRLLNESEFMRAVTRVGSHDGPALLFDWVYGRRLTDSTEIAYAVPYVWSAAKLPFNAMPRDCWLDLFRRAGYTEDGLRAERPAEQLTLYRGSEPRYVHRLAWTGSPDVAHKFLEINKRYGEKPRHVYTITVPSDRVLAHITDRQEDEYVVDSRGLRAQRLSS